jgi:ABC-type glycerol-3-phosphate transport system substrate-binding protein
LIDQQESIVKKISLFISFLLVTSFLVGCTNPLTFFSPKTPAAVTPTTSESIQVTPTPTIRVEAGDLKGVDIIFMYPWTGEVQIAVEEMVAEFNKSNEWGIRVTTRAPGSTSALAENVANGILNFAPPEVIAAPIDYLLRLGQSDEIVLNLNPYVESPQWGLTEEEISYFADPIWQQDVVEDYRYGIPAQRTAKVMIYNLTWADELGFNDPPVTPADFEQQVCTATGKLKLDSDETNDGLGGWIINSDGMTMASWLQAFDSVYYSNGKVAFNNSETIESLKYLRSLFDNDCAWLSTKPDPYAYFAERRTLVYTADLQELFLQQRAQGLAVSSDEWKVLPFPSSSEPFILAYGPSYAVLNTNEKKNLAAWLFVRWMSNVDHQGKIIKASGTLPLSENSVQYAVELEDSLPQWHQVADLVQYIKTPPSTAEWMNARIVLEDASWQLFKTEIKNEQIADLVKMMDQTLKEIENGTP